MRNLVVDMGNTAVKYAVFSGNQLVYQNQVPAEDALLADPDLQDLEHVLVSSVRAGRADWADALPRRGQVLQLSAQTPIPIGNGYESPQTLGADRLAAAVGANFLFPATDCLVIDAGTCITCDLVDAAGQFRGGSIAPGLDMKFRALHTFTQRLPLVTQTVAEVPLTGRNTAEAIRSGVLNGTLAEVQGLIGAYRQSAPDLRVVLCGGDAPFFESKLKEPIFAVPELVLIGLNSILNYNV